MSYYDNYSHDLFITSRLMRQIADEYDLVYCEDVERWQERDEATYITDEDIYVYHTDDYYYCEHCGRWWSYYEYNTHRDICYECERELLLVRDYHAHKGDYIRFGEGSLLIGAEIETDTDNWMADREEMARTVKNILGEHAYFEEDGSLSEEGFEIITQPHSLEAFKELPLREAFSALIDNDYRAHDTTTCGLHLHFSREWFGDTEAERVQNIAKMVMFYDKNWDKLYKLSRRDSTDSCARDYAYTNIDGDNVLRNIESAENLIDNKKYGSRYTAVNLTCYDRHGTVEFRLGRGTLNYNTFMAWVDLHRAIAEQSRTQRSYNFNAWINADTVEANTMDYITRRLGHGETDHDYYTEGELSLEEIDRILSDSEELEELLELAELNNESEVTICA